MPAARRVAKCCFYTPLTFTPQACRLQGEALLSKDVWFVTLLECKYAITRSVRRSLALGPDGTHKHKD